MEGLFTHFADAWVDRDFTQQQMEVFFEVTQQYRLDKVLHASNSAGTILGYGTDLDFVRPGVWM